eukprot:3721753-Rhodomonas_salina.1
MQQPVQQDVFPPKKLASIRLWHWEEFGGCTCPRRVFTGGKGYAYADTSVVGSIFPASTSFGQSNSAEVPVAEVPVLAEAPLEHLPELLPSSTVLTGHMTEQEACWGQVDKKQEFEAQPA